MRINNSETCSDHHAGQENSSRDIHEPNCKCSESRRDRK